MSLHRWRAPDTDQIGEVADRIAEVLQTLPDRRAALAHLIDASADRRQLADLLTDYCARWFVADDGQSILVGPELYWLLTASDNDDGRPFITSLPEGYGPPSRLRGMLLVCVLQSLAAARGPAAGNSIPLQPHRVPTGVAPLNTTVVSHSITVATG
jgi:hypothetical protein